MAKYSIELRDLLKTNFDIGLKDYPIPKFADEAWRKKLNDKIIDHYLFDEIGCTSPDRWKHLLNAKMNEIMPIKCLMYEALNTNFEFDSGSTWTETLDENRKANTEHTGDKDGTNDGTSNTTDNATNYNLQVGSDTPGQMLNIETDIANNTYASTATKEKGNSSDITDGKTHSQYQDNDHYVRDLTEDHDYTKKQVGVANKSNSELYAEYIKSINNIDMEIIRELRFLFMGVF